MIWMTGAYHMTENEKRSHRCAFTGHRPEKLKICEEEARRLLLHGIQQAYSSGYNVFISGMARGVDLWAADIVLSLKKLHPDIKLMCAVPFTGHDLRWAESDRIECRRILQNADLVVTVCKGYSGGCFQLRNQWMIDHCSRLIAVWNGKPSGTGNAVRYAQAQGIESIYLL